MIDIRGLRKLFKGQVALQGLSVFIQAGSIHGFIGPNGAGKSTTIKILSTLILPSAGIAMVDGHDIRRSRDEVKRIIGYMPESTGLYEEMSLYEYMEFFCRVYGIHHADRHQLIGDLLELVDLTEKSVSRIHGLSRGMRQRLLFAKTLIHDPKVLLLDEPASGLDPRSRAEMKALVKELQNMGKTVLISSHILPELADICDSLTIIERGSLVLSGGIKDIYDRVRSATIVDVTVSEGLDIVRDFLEANGAFRVDIDERSHVIEAEFHSLEEGRLQAMFRELAVVEGACVTGFQEKPVDLEEVFMKTTRGLVQ